MAPVLALAPACQPSRQITPPAAGKGAVDAAPAVAPLPPVTPWYPSGGLAAGETYVLGPDGARRGTIAKAREQGRLDVDLSDEWVLFIFSESDESGGPPKPNPYRATFVVWPTIARAPRRFSWRRRRGRWRRCPRPAFPRERRDRDAAGPARHRPGQAGGTRAARPQLPRGLRHSGDAFRVARAHGGGHRGKACFAHVDLAGLSAFDGNVTFQSREQAKQEYSEALSDAAWVGKLLATEQSGADATTGKIAARPARSDDRLGRRQRCAAGQAREERPAARQAHRALPPRPGALAGDSRRAGAAGLRGAADSEGEAHARDLRSGDQRGAGRLGAQEQHLRLGLSGRGDAGGAAAADHEPALRYVSPDPDGTRRRQRGDPGGRVGFERRQAGDLPGRRRQ